MEPEMGEEYFVLWSKMWVYKADAILDISWNFQHFSMFYREWSSNLIWISGLWCSYELFHCQSRVLVNVCFECILDRSASSLEGDELAAVQMLTDSVGPSRIPCPLCNS